MGASSQEARTAERAAPGPMTTMCTTDFLYFHAPLARRTVQDDRIDRHEGNAVYGDGLNIILEGRHSV